MSEYRQFQALKSGEYNNQEINTLSRYSSQKRITQNQFFTPSRTDKHFYQNPLSPLDTEKNFYTPKVNQNCLNDCQTPKIDQFINEVERKKRINSFQQFKNNQNQNNNEVNYNNAFSMEYPKTISEQELKEFRKQQEALFQRASHSLEVTQLLNLFNKSLQYLDQMKTNEQQHILAIKYINQKKASNEQNEQKYDQQINSLQEKIIHLEQQNEENNKLILNINKYEEFKIKYKKLKEELKQKEETNQKKELQIEETQKKCEELDQQNNELLLKIGLQNQQIQKQQVMILQAKQESSQELDLRNQIKHLNEYISNQNNQIEYLEQQEVKYKSLSQNFEKLKRKFIQKNEELKSYKQENIKLQQQLSNEKQLQKEAAKKKFNDISLFNNNNSNLQEHVSNVLTKLNPKVQLDQNLVQFTKAYTVIEQSKPSTQELNILKAKNDSIVNQFQTYQININSPDKKNDISSQPMVCIQLLQNIYKENGINTYITDEKIQNLEKSESYQMQQNFIQNGLHNQASYYSLKVIEETPMYNKIIKMQSEQNLNQFISDLKQEVGQQFNCANPEEDIVVINCFCEKDFQIDFQVNSKQYSTKHQKKDLSLDGLGLSLSEKSLLENAKLSVDMFDPQHNMVWDDSYQGKFEYRGQLKFYNQINPQPFLYYFPAGYKGYALKIDRYGKDKSWISSNCDEKTWIVLFHGTNEIAIKNIVKNNLIPGKRNYYQNAKCRITNSDIKAGEYSNVYLTDDVKIAEKFATETSFYKGKKFLVIFQCRVNPKEVKSPISMPSYFTVENNENIRPYRIIIREC